MTASFIGGAYINGTAESVANPFITLAWAHIIWTVPVTFIIGKCFMERFTATLNHQLETKTETYNKTAKNISKRDMPTPSDDQLQSGDYMGFIWFKRKIGWGTKKLNNGTLCWS